MTVDDQESGPLLDVLGDDRASTELAAIIRALEPGDRLPSERSLAEKLHVSRTTLRDRLGVLEGLGVLKRQVGAGTFVEPLRPSALAATLNLAMGTSDLPLDSLESVRVALERQAAREAAQRSDPVLVAYMRRAVDTMNATLDNDDLLVADRAFHQALLRAAGNPALTFFADALSTVLWQDLELRSSRLERSTQGIDRQKLIVDRHFEIYEAILQSDVPRAMAAVDGHFDALHVS